MILIRLLDPRFEKTGVAAGMSGSPVYFQDKLAGALAFAWPFASEPVAGVTPFSRMMGDIPGDEWDVHEGESSPSRPLPDIVLLAEAVRDGRIGEMAAEIMSPGEIPETVLPLGLGLGGALSGFHAEGWLKDVMEHMGFQDVSAIGRSREETESVRPGAMISAILVNGDALMAAGGTVTEIRGDQIWAFGHPFFGLGRIRMPLARASVVTILPSLYNSFKIFNSGAEIGTLFSDRRHGIWGKLGSTCAMVPMHLEIDEKSYDFGILSQDFLGPLLIAYLIKGIDAIDGPSLAMQSFSVDLDITFDDGRLLDMHQVFEGVDASGSVSAWAAAVNAYLWQSSFDHPRIDAVDCHIERKRGLYRKEIISAVPSTRVVAPGEEITLRVNLLASDGSRSSRDVAMKIPENLPRGSLNLVVADGASWAAYDLRVRPMLVQSFDDQLALLARLKTSAGIVTAFEIPGRGLVTTAGSVPVPAGLLVGLRSAMPGQVRTTRWWSMGVRVNSCDGPVIGALRLKLEVDPDREREER